jgi:pimeloyl-ACP methyl ester carboxylesterase
MSGQAYVQSYAPQVVRQPFPIVMIHGGHQSAVNFETTPDGRPGWAERSVEAGFAVYLLDQPGRGRSAFTPEYGRPDPPHTTARIEQRTTAPEAFGLWPQAHLHTQWPGTGRAGDPIFDQFYASQVPEIADRGLREELVRVAGVALLERIGPAILLTHSQSGHQGWQIGDTCPELVRAIVAIEPGGPPSVEIATVGAPGFFEEGERARPFGLTYNQLAYEPAVVDPEIDLPYVRQESPVQPTLAVCSLQQEPARRLKNLARIPVVVITGEASYHAPYDHCTARYLRQAGVDAVHVRLEDFGIRGNGHMMMLEKNSDEIVRLIHQLLRERHLAM